MVAPTRERTSRDIGKARISKSGQVTIPAEIRRELDLEAGDMVVYTREKDGRVSIRKPRSAAQLAGIARRPADGSTVTELIQEMDRTPIVRSRYQERVGDADID